MSNRIPLTDGHIERLQNALLAAYDEDGLRRMVRLRLGEDLTHIVAVPGRTLTEITYDLVCYYGAQAKIPELLAAARQDNPQNPQLAALADELQGKEFEPRPLPENLATATTIVDQRGQQVGTQIIVEGNLVNVPTRPFPVRALSIAVVCLLGLLAAGTLLWQFYPALLHRWAGPACAGIPLCAVVAEPGSSDPVAAHDLALEIAQQIRDVVGPGAPDQVKVAIVPSVEDSDGAHKVAAEEGALLAVWGRILQEADKLRVHFELSNMLGIGESHSLRTLRAEPLLYDPIAGRVVCANCFDIAAGEVGQRVAIVAHAAAGLLHYAEEPEQAYADFMAALYCAGEEIEPKLLAILQPACAEHARPADWNPALLRYYAGKAAVLSGSYSAGIALLQAAAAANAYDPAAPLGIAAAYQEWIGDAQAPAAVTAFADAVRRVETLLPDMPNDAGRAALYHDLGLIFELQGDWARARDSYAKAVDLFGGGEQSAYASLVRLGSVLAQGGDAEGAAARFKQAQALDKAAPWAYLGLANLAWAARKDRAAAEDWLRQAEQASPDAAYVQIQRAELCSAWDDMACAEQAYQAALARRPSSGWLRGRTGDFYRPTNPVRAGQSWDKAAEQYNWAVEFRPQDPWAHERLAYVLLNQGRAAAAVEHYKEAISLAYGDSAPAHLYCSLAFAQEQAGQAADAQASQVECKKRSTAP